MNARLSALGSLPFFHCSKDPPFSDEGLSVFGFATLTHGQISDTHHFLNVRKKCVVYVTLSGAKLRSLYLAYSLMELLQLYM